MTWRQVNLPGAGQPGLSDDVSALAVAAGESRGAVSDVGAQAVAASYADSRGTLSEAKQVGVSGYADAKSAPSDTIAGRTDTWATSNTTSGTAPTNPTNAQGENNGATAQVKAGGIANGTSTLNLIIPRASIPSTGAYMLRAFYAVTAGATDTFTASYAQIGGPSGTLPNSGSNQPATAVLTGLHATNDITVTFTHAAVTPSLGGNIAVDAVGVRTEGAF